MNYKARRTKFLVKYLHLPEATGVPDAAWEHFQLEYLEDTSRFRIDAKSRQIAFSWVSAAGAMADALLGREDTIFVSINLEEAKEKIRYARHIYEVLRMNPRTPTLPALTRDNMYDLELENGARLTSLPSRPPRGRARSKVIWDEAAHGQHDRQIYTAMLPIISKGGDLRIGSSPLGASGVFWEVYAQAIRPYPGYRRKATPWWEVMAFCTNVREARGVAPTLTTAQRVARFGNERIQAIYANMPEEDFRQEYECDFVDETTAWITWEEIKAAQDASLLYEIVNCRDGNIDAVAPALERLRRLSTDGKIEEAFGVGVDIGRTRNTTEIHAVGLTTLQSYPLRLMISLDNMPFDQQADCLRMVLDMLPVARMVIDQTGIGRNLAETMGGEYPGKAVGVDFTLGSKLVWATDAKMLIQKSRTPLPVDRDLAYQIHSIKRLVTPSRNLTFDADRNEKHHADKFWAWALGLSAIRTGLGLSDALLAQAFNYL